MMMHVLFKMAINLPCKAAFNVLFAMDCALLVAPRAKWNI